MQLILKTRKCTSHFVTLIVGIWDSPVVSRAELETVIVWVCIRVVLNSCCEYELLVLILGHNKDRPQHCY